MKKRFLLPLLLVGTPIAIGVADAAIHIAGCNFGNQGACAELTRREAHSKELDAKREAQTAKPQAKSDYDKCLEYKKQWPDAYDCEGIKNFRSPNELVRLAKSQQLGFKCKEALKASLKDPQSYRELQRLYLVNSPTEVQVYLKYTATNGFGGRVQGTEFCNYTL